MPPMTELKSYPLPELEALAERIKTEILKREQEEQDRVRQAAEDLARKTAEAERLARAEAEAVAEAAAAVEAAAEAERTAREATPVRYMHPSNRALTWNGVPPRPEWIGAWLTTGGTLYALEVAAEKLAPKPIPGSFRLK
jgi:DNA-binding protein H-NS